MRACVLMGVMTLTAAVGLPAAAQVSNSPLYQPSASVAPPSWPAWQGMLDGRAVLAPQYLPAPRYPTDSRNLTLDNRAPTLWPAGPDLRDAAPRPGSLPESGALGTGLRRSDGLRAPATAEPGRPSWR
jgi:hypothetical protein